MQEKMKAMVYDAETVVSNEQPDQMVKRLGELLHEGWELKKGLSNQVTNSLIDEAYSCGLSAGAYGGKISGAGGGGFLTFLAPPEKHPSIRNALKHLLEVNFQFENEGSTIIYLN